MPFTPPDLTLGLDISDNTIHYCAIDAGGDTVERGHIPNRRDRVVELLGRFAGARVVLEVSTHARWIALEGGGLGHEVLLANPRQLPLIYKVNDKSDEKDCERLAKLGRFDPELLRPVHLRSSAAREAMMVLNVRDLLVRQRTQAVNSVRTLAKAEGLKPPKCKTSAFGPQMRAALPEDLLIVVEPLIEIVEELTLRIKAQDKVVEELCDAVYDETELLRQVDGVGTIVSLAYVAVVDDPSRFASSRDVAAYLGLVPRRDQSGETDRQLGITKSGDRFVRRMLVQSAQRILGKFGKDSDLRRWGLALAQRKGGAIGKRKAVIGVARKLAVLLHRLWVTGEVYEPLRNANKAA